MTQQKIKEWCDAFDDNVYVSFSGGKDSTVLAHLVEQTVGEGTIPLVFCDTGLEYPEVRKFATERASVVLRPKKSFKQVIDEHGYPFPSKEQARYVDDVRRGTEKMRQLRLEGRDGKFKLSKKWMKLVDAPFNCNDYCCTVMKKAPFKAYEKQTGRKPMLATMACESRLRFNRYIKNGGCNAFDNKRPTSTPMGFWTDDDVYQYIYENDLEIPSVYGEIIRSGGGGPQQASTEPAAYSACSESTRSRTRTDSSNWRSRTRSCTTTALTS